jgi:hypothetical protein
MKAGGKLPDALCETLRKRGLATATRYLPPAPCLLQGAICALHNCTSPTSPLSLSKSIVGLVDKSINLGNL